MGNLVLGKDFLEAICREYPTPFYLYDEMGVLENVALLNSSFAWNEGFREFFAVKALPNPEILVRLKTAGLGCDCSSLAELIISEQAGFQGEGITFTSNDTPLDDFKKARELDAIINLDDLTHFKILAESGLLPELISFRYNPGPARAGNAIIGHPEEAKFGVTRQQLFDGYSSAKARGIKRFGIHTMLASNELDYSYFVETVNMLIDLVGELTRELAVTFEFINIGGGIGIPYRPEEVAVDLASLGRAIQDVFVRRVDGTNLAPLRLFMECGRAITGAHGYLITRVIHTKDTYRRYLGVDASMANLMRPGMYGSYHHISVPGKERMEPTELYDVVGSLCENNDKFAIQRPLPCIERGDLLVIHDVGAHGHSMGFNYNGKLRSAELLLTKKGEVKCIRRAETLGDYFATLKL